MSSVTLEERVARLEQMMDLLVQGKAPSQPGREDWQTTFGMFAGDPVMKDIIDAGQRIREDDRRQAAP